MKQINVREFKSGITNRTKTLDKYLEEIRKYPIIDVEEEIELFDKIKNGDEKAREKIINSNQRFVFAIAKRYCSDEKVMDLVDEGNLGLMEAIPKFDNTRGMKFISFAVWYIRKDILRYLMNDNLIIRKSNYQKTNGKVNAIKNKYFCENGNFPTDDEIIELMKSEFNIDVVNKSDIYEVKAQSINEPYCIDDDKTVEESPEFTNKTHSTNDYEEVAETDYYKTIIKGMLKKLTDRERKIVELSFGINCEKEFSNSEIGFIMGMTGERARQIKHEALKKMQNFQVQNFC